jgi:predicted amidohydrolase
MALKGAEIIFVPSAARTWRKEWRSEMWEILIRARAYENCIYVVAVNKAGQEDETTYLGRSMIVSPVGGKILAVSEKDDFDTIMAEIDLEKLQEAREELPVYRDRRPEFYSLLAKADRT